MIAAAQKPMLYIGGGVGMAQAVPALRDFISVTGIPAVATLKGLGAPDATDPCYLGMLGMHGTKAANLAVQSSDDFTIRHDDRFGHFAEMKHIGSKPVGALF